MDGPLQALGAEALAHAGEQVVRRAERHAVEQAPALVVREVEQRHLRLAAVLADVEHLEAGAGSRRVEAPVLVREGGEVRHVVGEDRDALGGAHAADARGGLDGTGAAQDAADLVGGELRRGEPDISPRGNDCHRQV